MPFIRKTNPTYRWPVTVETPEDGAFERQTFDAVFRRLGRSALTKLQEKGDTDLLEAVLDGWDGIKNEDGKDVNCTAATRREMFDDPAFVRGLLAAYLESLEGSKTKN